MAATLQKLKDQGWHLSEDGLKKLAREDEQQVTDVRELVKRALDMDLREISKGGGLSSDNMKSSKLDVPTVGVVVQVTSVRNVTAPKANEESKTSPRLLQLDLTDGQNVCVALEMEHIQCLSINTAPGTKILLKGNIKMSHGMLMLGPSNVSLIGGLVPTLFEKWEQNRVMAKYAKGIRPNAGPNGPPPWISFGQQSVQQQTLSKDRTFKSMGTDTPEESKENAEFTAMRNEAIAQANKAKTKKVFGGGKRNLVDHNVKKIIDKGFTEEEAQLALKFTRNNLERAMVNLKRDRAVQAGLVVPAAPEVSGRFGKGGRERRGRDEEPEGAKPSGKVSLFDFLTDKIPLTETIPVTSYNTPSAAPNRTSFAAPSKPVNQNTSNNYTKRSDDASSNHQKRSDDNRRPDSNRRSDDGPKGYSNRFDDGPKGYSTKNEENHNRKSNASASAKPSHSDESSKSRAPRTENGHAGRSSKPVVNGTSNSDRGSSASSIPSSQTTVSSKNPFSLENRAKFQNNVSASFANRSKRDDVVTENNGNRSVSNKKDVKPATSRPTSNNDSGKSARESQRPNNESVRSQNHNSRKGGNDSVDSANKSQAISSAKPSKGSVPSNDNSAATRDNKRYENPFSKPVDRRRGKTEPKPRYTPSPALSQDSKVAQLIKSTADLKLNEPQRPKPSKSTPSATASVHSTNSSNNNSKSHSGQIRSKTQPPAPKPLDQVFPNGFEFNPNKIMGFTNKETNEVAQNMLKAVSSSTSNDMLSQLLGAASAASNKLAAQSSLSPLPEAFVPAAAAHPQPPVPSHNPNYSVRPVSSPQKQPIPQPHFQQAHAPQFMSPIVSQPQHPPQQMVGLQHFKWALKLHDLCFAKYWEDGRYYHAEITGMSDSTCVVEFMEYGNFEEVLITDCVPITEDNIQMINQYNAGLALQPVGHFQPAHIQQQQPLQAPPLNSPVVPVAMHVPVQYQTQAPPLMHQQPLLQTPQHPPHPHHHHQQQLIQQPSPLSYQPQQPQQFNSVQYNQQQQQHLQRMRNERQMYVPPAQRSTK